MGDMEKGLQKRPGKERPVPWVGTPNCTRSTEVEVLLAIASSASRPGEDCMRDSSR